LPADSWKPVIHPRRHCRAGRREGQGEVRRAHGVPGCPGRGRRAFIGYIIDTTNITIDGEDRKDTRFDKVIVISKDGFPIRASVKGVIAVARGR
jgi:hypothetical protein